MAISKETIIEASIKILNRDGVENLSMRTLAKELDIKAASLYWHIKNKQELYGEIAEFICSQYTLPNGIGDAKAYVGESCKAYRAMLLAVRDSVTIFQESHPNTPRRMELIRSQTEAITKMKIKKGFILAAANIINNFVLSFVADELRIKNTSPEQLTELAKELSPEEKSDFDNIGNFDENFNYGLSVIFMGLENVE